MPAVFCPSDLTGQWLPARHVDCHVAQLIVAMMVTLALQSLWPVLPPNARAWMVSTVPGVRLVSTMRRAWEVTMPLTHVLPPSALICAAGRLSA